MAKKIVNLRGMPDDEIQEIRNLLDENKLSYYETPAGNWGISLPSLWLTDEKQYDNAVTLLSDYQKHRYERVHSEYNELKSQGKHDTLIKRLKREPLAVLFYAMAIIAIAYLSIYPFV